MKFTILINILEKLNYDVDYRYLVNICKTNIDTIKWLQLHHGLDIHDKKFLSRMLDEYKCNIDSSDEIMYLISSNVDITPWINKIVDTLFNNCWSHDLKMSMLVYIKRVNFIDNVPNIYKLLSNTRRHNVINYIIMDEIINDNWFNDYINIIGLTPEDMELIDADIEKHCCCNEYRGQWLEDCNEYSGELSLVNPF
jgi:hypothetical protein